MLSLPAILPATPDAQKRLPGVDQSSDMLSALNSPMAGIHLESSVRMIAQALGNSIDSDASVTPDSSSELGDLTPLTWLPTFRVAEVDNEEEENASRSVDATQPDSNGITPEPQSSQVKAKPRPLSKPRATRMSTKSPDKPRYSFANLIFMAIENSDSKCLPVKAIYDWILHHFPYFKELDADPKRSCWRNSVRHNLSLNPAFMKMLPSDGSGKRHDSNRTGKHSCKGAFWVVNPSQREQMMQALAKTGPIHPGLFPSVDSNTKTWSADSGGIEHEIAMAMLDFRYAKYGRPKAAPVDRPLSCPPSLNENEFMSTKAARCVLRDMDVRPQTQPNTVSEPSTAKTDCDAPGLDAVAEAACQARKANGDKVEEKFLSGRTTDDDDDVDKGDVALVDSGFNDSTVDSALVLTADSVNNDEAVAAKSLMFLFAQAHRTSQGGRKPKRKKSKKRNRECDRDLPAAKKVRSPPPKSRQGSSRRKVKKPARYLGDNEIVITPMEWASKEAKLIRSGGTSVKN